MKRMKVTNVNSLMEFGNCVTDVGDMERYSLEVLKSPTLNHEVVTWSGDFPKHIMFWDKEPKSDSAIDFLVIEVVAWNDNKPGAAEPITYDPYFTIMIKWDGCSHLNVADRGYLHLCGVNEFKDHIKVVEAVYRKAEELLGSNMSEDEKWES